MSASYSPSGRFRLKLLALAVGAATLPAMAATETSQTATSPASNEQTLTVTATADYQFTQGGDQLVPADHAGPVAIGGGMGMLGEQEARNVRVNIVSQDL